MSNQKFKRLILAVSHLVLGVLLFVNLIGKVYSSLVVVFGILFIIRSKNRNNEVIYWSAYIVGLEVLLRMSGGMFFYELPKYATLLFLIIGLIVEKRPHHISISYVLYILLLLIGIAFVNIPFNESIRKAIAFNLSGPVLLGVSAIYFYKRKLHVSEVLNMLFYMGLPIISMLSYLYFKTPDVKKIFFGGVSNFAASGGYGPNQVATLLGVGVFIFAVHIFYKQRFFYILTADVFIFMYLIFRGLITFSRGGMITAFAAVAIFTFHFVISKKDKLKDIIKYTGMIAISGIALWLYTSDVTGGMLINRYTNKNAAGKIKKDVSAGRVDLFKTELEVFFNNPFFGIGVGGGKYYRKEKLDIEAASHNEMSRLLGEHGMIGIIILLILLTIPILHFTTQPYLARAFIGAFFVFWFLTINHSAMRIAFPGFIYGLSVVSIYFDSKEEQRVKEPLNS